MNFKSATKTIAATIFAVGLLMLLLFRCSTVTPVSRDYYEVRIYHISDSGQEATSDNFFRDVFIPALHRAGIGKVGIFKPVEADTLAFGKLIYIFIPFTSFDQYISLNDLLSADITYNADGKFFLDASFDNPPYDRYESILLKAFRNMPHFAFPQYDTPKSERIYELRSYESATEFRAIKKIEMFNDAGEIKLFEDLGFNPVFFGEVIAGSHKPNLMYMTSFSDMTSHDEHWKAFSSSDGWKTMSALDEYKNTVSRANISLLHPTLYSDF
jgi:hypothetical protein